MADGAAGGRTACPHCGAHWPADPARRGVPVTCPACDRPLPDTAGELPALDLSADHTPLATPVSRPGPPVRRMVIVAIALTVLVAVFAAVVTRG